MNGLPVGDAISGIILGLGAATRFGQHAQLARVDGRPVLEHATLAIAASGLDRFVVVLGPHAEDVLESVDLHGGEAVICDRWEDGQAAALASGLAAVEHDSDAVVVTRGDQAGLAPECVYRLLSQRGRAAAVRATYGDRPGHPVVLERSLFAQLRDAAGDVGIRGVLRRAGAHEVACDDLGTVIDIDGPPDVAALRVEASTR